MKKALAAAGIGAALAIGALAIAPAASASPASFLNHMHAQGFWNTGGDAGMLSTGYWVCNQLDAGWTPAAATAAISVGNYYPDGSAGLFAAIATTELCPWHAPQDFYESRPLYVSSRAVV
jgi:uncharacterized protein (DUF1501 family)